jgi:hypothetical protein
MAAKKKVKRGRKPGVKIGPYKVKSLSTIAKDLKDLKARVAKLEKILN